jgi:hypothetical protein
MRLRKVIRAAALLVGIAVVGFAISFLYNEHYWPFSCGSNDEAFLGTTFGMSRPEVARTLKKHNAQLVSYSEYRSISGDEALINHTIDLTPLLASDERDWYSLYMPSIEMFDATTEAVFEFEHSRLRYVYVHFSNKSKPQSVVDSLTAALQSHYKLAQREESKSVPGAYTLHFQSESVTPLLWVNLTDAQKPITVLSIARPSDDADRQRKIQQRQDSAFGR